MKEMKRKKHQTNNEERKKERKKERKLVTDNLSYVKKWASDGGL
jgi:hypothetical protein